MDNLPAQSDIDKANAFDAEIESDKASLLLKAIQYGHHLTEMKKKVPTGTWMKWCAKNITTSRSNINNYMLVAGKEHKLADYQRAGKTSLRGFIGYYGKRNWGDDGTPDPFEGEPRAKFKRTADELHEEQMHAIDQPKRNRQSIIDDLKNAIDKYCLVADKGVFTVDETNDMAVWAAQLAESLNGGTWPTKEEREQHELESVYQWRLPGKAA